MSDETNTPPEAETETAADMAEAAAPAADPTEALLG